MVFRREMEIVKQYDLWWASLPQPLGRRPVLLLSRNEAYSYLNKFAAVEITSTIRRMAVEVPLGRVRGSSRNAWPTATTYGRFHAHPSPSGSANSRRTATLRSSARWAMPWHGLS